VVVKALKNERAETMTRFLILGLAAWALTACAPSVPDSAAGVPDTGRGVGFQNYEAYERAREAQLSGQRTTINGPVPVQSAPLDADAAAEGRAAAQAAAGNSGVAPVEASPSNAAPPVVTNAAGISNENNFDAVSSQRDIQADAALIAQNRANYQVVSPTDLPTRSGSSRPNVVEFALRTTNPKGTALYRRSGFNAEAKFNRACAGFTSDDLAQEEFLAKGGPQKDRLGVDPDGDGFACNWDPAPFRAVRGG
jgi:hypothetical protein